MSKEETKGEAGGTEVALTEEKCLYDAAVQRCKEAGVDLDEARKDLDKAKKKLRDWEAIKGDENDRYRQLKQEVNDADQRYRELDARFEKCNQRLKDANNLLKDAER